MKYRAGDESCVRAPVLVLAFVALLPHQLVASPMPDAVLADNREVLQLWAQETGGRSPDMVRTGDGGTRLEWRNGISYDQYRNNSRGGDLLTPVRDENTNYSVQLQTEAKASWRAADTSWFMFGGTASDDRAVLEHPALISTLQLGHSGEDYQVMLGDVPVNLSTLGATTGLRGLQGERAFGRTRIQAVAGVQSETWESISREERRTRYLRDAFAVKIDHALNDAFGVYLTTQAYSDDEDDATALATGLATSDGSATTAGFSFSRDRFTLNAEAGISDWEEQGVQDEHDDAWIVDAGWQGDRIGLQAGHHDLGVYYTSLSGAALSGVEETYGSGSLVATDWLSFNGDLRHTVNDRALAPDTIVPPYQLPYTPNAYKSDSWTLGSNIAVLPVEGLNLQLTRSESNGSNEDGGDNDFDDTSINLQWAVGEWSTGLGYQRSDLENSATPTTDSVTRGWNYLIGRQWSDGPDGNWTLNATAIYNDQRQELDAGPRTGNDNYTLSLAGQHVRWGEFSILWYDSQVRDPETGNNLDQHGYQIEAGRPLGRLGLIKLYYSRNDSFDDKATIAYEERTLGLRFQSGF